MWKNQRRKMHPKPLNPYEPPAYVEEDIKHNDLDNVIVLFYLIGLEFLVYILKTVISTVVR